MPTITAQSIVDKVQIQLQDTAADRWTEAELLGWLNDGQRVICTHRPDASAVLVTISTVAGSKQTLPAGGTALLDVVRNTSGAAVRPVSMQLLDAHRRNWHTETQAATKHYCYDPRTPKVFYVYPPAVVSAQLDIKYQAPPADVAALANVISVDDIYEPALVDYLLYRAFSKETEAGNQNIAAAALERFNNLLGVKTGTDMAVAPDNSEKG